MTQSGDQLSFSGVLTSRQTGKYDPTEQTIIFDYKDSSGFEYYFVYALG